MLSIRIALLAVLVCLASLALAGGPTRSRSRSPPQRRNPSPARVRTNGVIRFTVRARDVMGDTAYEIPIGLGTPRQPFHVSFDSGSRRLMIPHRGVTFDFGEDGSVTGERYRAQMYDENNSETHELVAAEADLGYMTASGNGPSFNDRISFGHGAKGIPMSHSVNFVAANTIQYLDAGIMGFAPNAEIFRQMKADGLIARRIATVSLKRRAPRQGTCNDCGKITLGVHDRKICGATVATLPMQRNADYWRSRIHGATFNGVGAQDNGYGFDALLDTGSAAFRFPSDVAATLAEQMGAQWIEGAYRVPCGGKWRHKFELHMPGGVRLSFSRNEIITKFNAQNCQLMILPHDLDAYTLGVPFLAKYCVVLDAEGNRIIVAKKKSGLLGLFGK